MKIKICEEHPNNNRVGGCISCTFWKMRRFEQLYEEAVELLMAQRLAAKAAKITDMHIGWFIEDYHKGDHHAEALIGRSSIS